VTGSARKPAYTCARRHALAAAAPITAATDFNRDGRVNALDVAIVKRNLARSLAGSPASAAPTETRDAPERATASANEVQRGVPE